MIIEEIIKYNEQFVANKDYEKYPFDSAMRSLLVAIYGEKGSMTRRIR